MGHEAAVTKKRVLGKVEDCIAAVNDIIGAVETLERQHNALCAELATKQTAVDDRLSAQGAWCESNESGLGAVRRGLAEEMEQRVTVLAEVHTRLDRLAYSIELLAKALLSVRAESEAFDALGLIGRLRWLFTGWRPTQAGVPYVAASPDPAVPAPPVSIATTAPVSQSVTSPAGAFTL